MKQFTYEKEDSKFAVPQFRIADAQDNRIATCFLEENARLVTDLMNRGVAVTELLFAARSAQAALRATSQAEKDYSYELRLLKASIAAAEGEAPFSAAPDLLVAAKKAVENYVSYLTSGEGPRSFIPSMDALRVAVAAAEGGAG